MPKRNNDSRLIVGIVEDWRNRERDLDEIEIRDYRK